ncbi:MAG TPA: hypothetical protein VJ044_01370, partial [Candidatus Hodarchaeales archaeon]|nr:hypothetical protein [Candidatus Hodarchaeales archaeon]
MSERAVVFVDSSILIAKVIRDKEMKARIKNWLSRYKLKVSGTVALQEFKRRVLRDLAYLLTKLNQNKSYQKTLNYVTSVLPVQQQRKKNICILILHSILPGSSDEELTERARLYCRTLLVNGENLLNCELDSIVSGINCYWSRIPIREKKRYVAYELGEMHCSKSKKQCQVGGALEAKKAVCENLLNFLKTLPTRRITRELQSALEFLDRIVDRDALQRIHDEEPCSTVG